MCVRDFVLGSIVGMAVGLTVAPVVAEAQANGIREVSASERSLIPLQTRVRYTTLVVLPDGEKSSMSSAVTRTGGSSAPRRTWRTSSLRRKGQARISTS